MKFYGQIGYADTVETSPDIWEEQIIQRPYYGDVIKRSKRNTDGQSINDDVIPANTISILADPYANNHFFNIRYVNWMGANWKVSNVDVETPRLVLTLGGVYNGNTN